MVTQANNDVASKNYVFQENENKILNMYGTVCATYKLTTQ